MKKHNKRIIRIGILILMIPLFKEVLIVLRDSFNSGSLHYLLMGSILLIFTLALVTIMLKLTSNNT